MMKVKVQDLIHKSGVIIDLGLTEKFEALTSIVHFLCSVNELSDPDAVAAKIAEREAEVSTGIGYGIAIPHARLPGISNLYMVAARVAAGIEFDSLDGMPVNLIFMMVSPANTSTEHAQVLSALSQMMSYEDVRKNLLEAETPDAFVEVIVNAENKYVGAL